jgi:hypothetical protein
MIALMIVPVVAVAGPIAPRLARADDKAACVAASDSGQSLKAAKKLRAARKQLLVCAADTCPGVVKQDCAGWLAEVDTGIPTVVVVAIDASGAEVTAVKVIFDGELLVDHLDGSAIPVDPGPHTFRYEGPDGAFVETPVVVREGEKNRKLEVKFDAIGKKTDAPPPPPPAVIDRDAQTGTSRAPIPTITWVLGGVGVVAIGSFAYFGLKGRSDVQHLRDTCAPACDSSDEKAAKNKLIVADVSLAIGVVSLGLATYFAFTATSAVNDKASVSKSQSLTFDAAAIPGGGVGFFGGRF